MKFKFKSLVVAVLMLSLVFLSGCEKEIIEVSSELEATSSVEEVSSEPTENITLNPLTGLNDLDPSAANSRPVAVMVNNISVAQSVQTGLDQADIVYETYAEGGITRLLAIYKDISKADQIGTIRSARYSYADLAMGHDAIYVHAGINTTHAKPHMLDLGIDNINLLEGKYDSMYFVEKNGKASEHTKYTTGEKLANGLEKLNWRTELNYNKESWQNFVAEGEEVTPAGGECTEVTVRMSGAQTSIFKYDSSLKKYYKYNDSKAHSDWKTGEQLAFKNVLVLKSTLTTLYNSKGEAATVKTELEGGTGYYISNGGYVEVNWTKGNAKNPIKITLKDGSTCDYNPGNTWVCLVDKKETVSLG